MLVFLVSPPPPPFFDLYENRRYFSFPTFSPASSPNLLLHFSSFPLILSFTASSFLFPPSISNIYLSFISHFTCISTSFGLPRSQSRSLIFSFHFQYLYLSFFIGLVPHFLTSLHVLIEFSLCRYSIPILLYTKDIWFCWMSKYHKFMFNLSIFTRLEIVFVDILEPYGYHKNRNLTGI